MKNNEKEIKRKKIGIYKITNPKGRVYIGQSIDIEGRFKTYKSLRCKNQPILYNSLFKYGINNHKFETIEECPIKYLNEREVFWKKYYLEQLSWKKVLFCEIYDQGKGGPMSEKTKQKISKSNKGRKLTDKQKENLSKAKKNMSDETRSKISKANKGRKLHKDGKSHSIFYTKKVREKISKNNLGKIIPKNVTKQIVKGKSKPILQYDLEGNFIREWKNTKEAGVKLNIPQTCITSVLKGRQRKTRKWIFKYKYENGKTNHQQALQKRR